MLMGIALVALEVAAIAATASESEWFQQLGSS